MRKNNNGGRREQTKEKDNGKKEMKHRPTQSR
jgi:hypothetical protein